VPHDLPVAEVLELKERRQHAALAPQHVGVEPHLEQRRALVACTRRAAGLVVDHADRAVRCDVQAVDDPAQLRSVLELRPDEDLTLVRLEPVRVLEREVGVQQVACAGEPRLPLLLGVEQVQVPGLLGVERLPRVRQHPDRGVSRPVARGQVEQVLEDRVHERPAGSSSAGRLGEPVDDAQTEQQRAAQEVVGTRRRQAGRRAPGGVGRDLGHDLAGQVGADIPDDVLDDVEAHPGVDHLVAHGGGARRRVGRGAGREVGRGAAGRIGERGRCHGSSLGVGSDTRVRHACRLLRTGT
jgi:hypothetical protein